MSEVTVAVMQNWFNQNFQTIFRSFSLYYILLSLDTPNLFDIKLLQDTTLSSFLEYYTSNNPEID